MRRTLLLTSLAVAALAATAAGLAVWPESTDASDPARPSGTTTVPVERRTLRDTERVSGQLDYADPFTIVAGGPGTLTGLPAEGSVVERGQPLYRVDDKPVVLLVGELPMWRELGVDVEDGRDVKQLERNLAELGYDVGEVDEDFSGYTEYAVEQWQEDLGLEVTGRVAPGDVVVAPGPVRVGALSAVRGQPLTPGVEIYAASRTEQVVVVDLDPADEELAVIGSPASVTLPNGSDVPATVTSVGAVKTTTAGDGTTTSTMPVTLTLDDPTAVGDLSVASVNVDLTREAKEDVLAVPVTALVALAEGGHAVHRMEEGVLRLVPVQPGLYADGYVEVVDGLAEGDEVMVPA